MHKNVVFSLLLCLCCIPCVATAKSISCENGTYLPPNSTTKEDCKPCPSHLPLIYCPNGKHNENYPYAQGIKLCKGNSGGNYTCDESKIVTIDAGLFIPENSPSKSQPCTGTNLAQARTKLQTTLANANTKKNINKVKQLPEGDEARLFFENLEKIAETDVGKLYCPGGDTVNTNSGFPRGIHICNLNYVTGENNSICTNDESQATSHQSSAEDYDSVWCDAGYYLPKGATEENGGYKYNYSKRINVCTAKCNGKYNRSDGYVCPGGWFKPSASSDMGLSKCSNTQIVSWGMTGCINCVAGTRKDFTECEPISDAEAEKMTEGTFSCAPGLYLITKSEYIARLKNQSSQSSLGNQVDNGVAYCMSCFDYGSKYSKTICPGVNNQPMTDEEQGREKSCPGNKVTTRDNPTTCIDRPKEENSTSSNNNDTPVADKTTCYPGFVLFNGVCTACTSNIAWVTYANTNRMYCPGGDFEAGTPVMKQIKKCPHGSWPNAALSDCECKWGVKNGNACTSMKLYFNDLQYGPNGKNAPLFEQCWTKTSQKAYKKCMGFDD